MRLGRASTYALQGLICLARHGKGSPLSVTDIAMESGVPMEYLRKLLQILTHAGLVRSERGRNGGFILAGPASRITVRQVIEAMEGPIEGESILAVDEYPSNQRICRPLKRWRQRSAQELRRMFDSTSLAKLVEL